MVDTSNTERYTPAPALNCTGAVQTFRQKWLNDLRSRVFDEGEPYIIADAVSPHEIFHVMDVPVVSVPWYSAVISAKRLSNQYFDYLETQGYHDGLPRYTSLPMASTMMNDPETAAYGGLPKPALILSRLRGDYCQRVTELWAKAFDCPHYVLDCSADEHLEPRWFEHTRYGWENLYSTYRLDYQVDQLRELISYAEVTFGKGFDDAVFEEHMQQVNALGEATEEAKNIIASTKPAPVPVTEQLHNIMTPTWFRGGQWATDHVRSYRDELQDRADKGIGACPNEKIRLLWLNNGLWHDTGFYRAFEEEYGAVFVWTMYSNFLSDAYRKYYDKDPLRALAARHISMNEQLHTNPWMSEWILQMAKDFGADGAVMLTPIGDRMSSIGTRGAINRCEEAGLPVVEIEASMVDARSWDRDAMYRKVGDFLETRVIPKMEGRA